MSTSLAGSSVRVFCLISLTNCFGAASVTTSALKFFCTAMITTCLRIPSNSLTGAKPQGYNCVSRPFHLAGDEMSTVLTACLRFLMNRINPINLLRLFHRGQVEIHHNRFLVASDHDARKGFIRIGVDFLMGRERRHINKITWPGVSKKLQLFTPTHPRSTADHVNDTFEFAVMMRRRLGIRMNIGSPGPELIGSRPSTVDRRRPCHARSLGCVEVEFRTGNDLNSIISPIVLRCSAHFILLFFLQTVRSRELIS